MMTKSFTTREKALMVILIVLLVVALYYLAVWRPTSETISAAREQIDSLADAMLVEEAKSAQIERMREALKEISDTAETLTITPYYDNAQSLLDELNTALAAASAYKLNFQTPRLADDIVRRDLQLLYYADNYAAAREIFSHIYAGRFRCDIVSFRLAPVEKSAANLLTASLTATLSITYYELNRSNAQ